MLDITFAVDGHRLEPVGDGSWRVTLAGALPLSVRDRPPLPFARRDVLLAGAANPGIEVIEADWQVGPCPPLGLSPGFVSRSAGVDPMAAGGTHRSATVAPFPQSPAWSTPVYTFRGLTGVGLVLCPFRYDQAAGTLAVCRSLRVRVHGVLDGEAIRRLSPGALRSALWRWPEQVAAALKTVVLPPVQESLLVLVPESLAAAPALQSFASWKHQRGVAVTTQLLPPQPGVAAVRALVRSFSESAERPHVLILGNEVAVPPGQSYGPPSDTVYTMLDGPADRYHDLPIARLSVTSSEDLALQLGRAEAYERWQWPTPSLGTWCSAAIGVASNENQGNLGLLDWQAMEMARTDLLDYGYLPCDAIYDTGGTVPGTSLLTGSWNEGRGLVLYLGHGLQQSWRTTGFTGNDVNLLLRYGPSLPVVVSAACYTGNFTLASDCLCESLLKGGTVQAPLGAVAAIGSTSAMDWDPPVVMLQSFTAYLTRRSAFTAGGLAFAGGPEGATAGDLTFAAVQRAVDFCLSTPEEGDAAARKIVEQVHLFGDPTLGVRTRKPSALAVSHPAEAVCAAAYEVRVTIAAGEKGGGPGLAGVTVCLSAPGVQWVAVTDETGLASIAIPEDAEAEDLTLTAYAADAIPYQAGVALAKPAAPVTIVTTALPSGQRGLDYRAVLEAQGGTGRSYCWTAVSPLPAGLALDEAGVLAGTPSGFGAWQVTVRVAACAEPDAYAEATFALQIESPVYVVSAVLAEAESCQPYDEAIAVAGSWPPFRFTVAETKPTRKMTPGSLPAWLSLSPAGRLTGMAPAATTDWISVTVTDASGHTCTTSLALVVRAAAADADGNGDVDSGELLAVHRRAQSGCATVEEWSAAVAQWQRVGGATPAAPEVSGFGVLSPRRVLGTARYLPGGGETVLIELGVTDALAPGSAAVLTEVLPAGWEVADQGARDAAGRLLPGPRREGQAVSWILDDQALRGDGVSIAVRPSRPQTDPVAFQGWVLWPDGAALTGGSYLWWARSERTFALNLESGWNLVSVPLDFPDSSVPAALAGMGLRHCAVAAQGQGSATRVAALVAYWAWARSPTTVFLNGFEPLRSEPPTAAGWSACGVVRPTSPSELADGPHLVWFWGPGGWEPLSGHLVPGRGYLFFRP
jgi:hypothetical protein